MRIRQDVNMDLNRPRKHMIHVSQIDNTREINLTLNADGMPYDMTYDLAALGIQDGDDDDIIKTVKYIKADGKTSGEYSTISTGEAAVVLQDGSTNEYTVSLDEHVTDIPGFAEIFVTFYASVSDKLYVLHSFPITVEIARNTTSEIDPGQPYYNGTPFLLKSSQAAKTPAMSFPVGVDGDGKLWAEGGWSAEAKEALLACFEQVAWKTTYGQTYLSALETALYPEVHLVSITADYEQDRPILDTDSLDLVKLDLVVTANYSDGTSETLADDAYTLTGALTVGTSTITVGYQGKTAEIEVVVSYTYEWSLANGKLIKVAGSTSGNETGHVHEIGFNNSALQQGRRRSYPTLFEGVEPYKDSNDNYSDTIYYPIPIPADAVKAKISITPATQYHGESMYTYEPGTGYTRQADPGWKQGSFTHTFTAGAYDYITVVSKYDSAGTTYPTEPTALVVEFLTE